MEPEVKVQKANLNPMELLQEAKDLMGDQYWLFFGITLVAMLIAGAVPMGILMGPMMCGLYLCYMGGLYLCYMERSRGNRVEFAKLFEGFEHFVESLIATLIVVAVSICVIVPAYFLMIGVFFAVAAIGSEAAGILMIFVMMIMMFVLMCLIYLIQLPFVFMYQLIVGHGLKAVPAIKTSFEGAKANFGGLLITVIVFSLISSVAVFLCVIPAYLFMPFSFGGFYVAYTKVFAPGVAQKPMPMNPPQPPPY